MLQVFDELLPYFDEETKGKIREITDNVDAKPKMAAIANERRANGKSCFFSK